MGKFKVTKTKEKTYLLTQKLSERVTINEYEMGIFDENLISHVMVPRQEKKKLIYQGTVSTTLNLYLKKGVTKHKLYSILAQAVEVTKELERYHFQLQNLVLEPKYVFVKEITGEVFWVYSPVYDRKNTFNFFEFLRSIVKATVTEDRQLKNELVAINGFLSDPANYRITDVEAFILRQYPQIYQEISRQEVSTGSIFTTECRNPDFVEIQQTSKPTLAEETTLLNENMYLSNQAPESGARIVRKSTGQEYLVNKPELIMGKSMDADIIVSDNTAISRHHARIYNNCGVYFLVDEASKNHTYHNGMMVTNSTGNRLASGDEIRLANEEFYFYLG